MQKKNETKIQILQTARKRLPLMGFYPKQQQNSGRAFGGRQLREIVYAVVSSISFGLLSFLVAESKEDYMYSVFSLTIAVGITVSFISLITENDKIFDTIDAGQAMINDS